MANGGYFNSFIYIWSEKMTITNIMKVNLDAAREVENLTTKLGMAEVEITKLKYENAFMKRQKASWLSAEHNERSIIKALELKVQELSV